MAVAYWVEAMARDEVLSKKDYEEQLKDQDLQDFMDGVLMRDRGDRNRGDFRLFRTGH